MILAHTKSRYWQSDNAKIELIYLRRARPVPSLPLRLY